MKHRGEIKVRDLGRGSGRGSRASGIGGYTLSQQGFERNFDNMVDPKIFLGWLTGYDDGLKSEVATWLWLQHIGSDFCSHSRDLCNPDLVSQVVATLQAVTDVLQRRVVAAPALVGTKRMCWMCAACVCTCKELDACFHYSTRQP